MSEHWIQTYDGKIFDLLDPDPDDIDPETIAVVLSRICRFGCHCKEFYSVAQHSLLVESLVDIPRLKLPALLHDAHEAYWGLGDLPRPVKLIPEIKQWLSLHAQRMDVVIATRFRFSVHLFDNYEIKDADNILLATEKRDLMLPPPKPWVILPDPLPQTIKPWDEGKSAVAFYNRLMELMLN